MAGVVVVREDGLVASWDSMMADHAPFGPKTADWRDDSCGVRFGATFTVREAARGPAIVLSEACAVVVDGALLPDGSGITDGERIASAYRRRGTDFMRTLHGSFAFVLWDQRDRLLVAGCDPVGERQLAYLHDGSTLVIASRAVALLRHRLASRRLDRTYLTHAVFDLWAQPSGTTAFEGIKRLRPGHVLVHTSGRVDERSVDRLAPRPLGSRARASDYEASFWETLADAAKSCVGPERSPCVSLSGGLDSSCVALATLESRSEASALFLDAPGMDNSAERAALTALLSRYPGLCCRTVACDDDVALSEPWDSLPILDEPVLLAAAYVPARLHLAREAASSAFGVVLDGEGGDEIFDLSTRVSDLLRETEWGAAWRKQGARAWCSTIVREMIVPKLGSTIGRRWLARSARAMPSWIRPSFFRSPALEQAREQRGEWASHGRTNEMLAALLHVAPTAGSRAGMRLLYASHAVELGSPMLDRRIVELAMALPSRLRAGASTKTFLRRAADERLPREVTDRPKDAGFYAAFQRRGLCHPRVDVALSRAGALSWSSEMIDVAALENRLRAIRAGSALSSSEAEQLCSVVSTISWTTRLAEQYAVSP